jgi:methylthioribose-1-phosphate isomerase
MGLVQDSRGLRILDQTKIPHSEEWISVSSSTEMIGLIQRLAVRGAPLIGVAAALSIAQEAHLFSPVELRTRLRLLREARPTAVNLMWAVDRMLVALDRAGPAALPLEAEQIFTDDAKMCEAMAAMAYPLLPKNGSVMTICNTGGLATVGIGTALGAIRYAVEKGNSIHVYVLETRPLGQGARLTVWELANLGIPYTLVTDSMAAFLMCRKKIHGVFAGADRVARNGDVANKIGTYGLALLAKHHGIPFHIVAPSSTFDSECANGGAIPIEERSPEEVRFPFAGSEVQVWNPAFDVTPASLITALVSENGLRENGSAGF